MNYFGIPVRVIHNPTEDHVWNEIYNGTDWVHFDASINRDFGYNHPEYYEEKWNKNVTYVYYIDENFTRHLVTDRYSKTGDLKVLVVRNNKPVENAKVWVFSTYLRNHPQLNLFSKAPMNVTDERGYTTFHLGDDTFEVLAQKGFLLGYKGKKTVTLLPDETKQITIELKFGLLEPRSRNLSWIIILSILLIIFFFGVIKIYFLRKD